jgi:hypothetical protein
MQCRVFAFSGSDTIRTWTPEEDCLLDGIQCVGGSAVLSENPALTLSTFTTAPTSNFSRDDVIAFISSGAAMSAMTPQFPRKFLLLGGRNYFLSSSAATNVLVYYTPVSQIS